MRTKRTAIRPSTSGFLPTHAQNLTSLTLQRYRRAQTSRLGTPAPPRDYAHRFRADPTRSKIASKTRFHCSSADPTEHPRPLAASPPWRFTHTASARISEPYKLPRTSPTRRNAGMTPLAVPDFALTAPRKSAYLPQNTSGHRQTDSPRTVCTPAMHSYSRQPPRGRLEMRQQT